MRHTSWRTWRGWARWNATCTLGLFVVSLAVRRDLAHSVALAGSVGVGLAVATAIIGLLHDEDADPGRDGVGRGDR